MVHIQESTEQLLPADFPIRWEGGQLASKTQRPRLNCHPRSDAAAALL